ncbi:hypothetical protein DEJ55_11275 [Bacillus pumilus]|nr:hypothetical protein DEJ55_11275 [Bacillus pumilus]
MLHHATHALPSYMCFYDLIQNEVENSLKMIYYNHFYFSIFFYIAFGTKNGIKKAVLLGGHGVSNIKKKFNH